MLRIVAFCALLALSAVPLHAEVIDVDSAGLERLRAEGVAVIDVRRPEEWRKTGVIEGSHLLTFFDRKGRYDLEQWLPALAAIAESGEPVALICRSGNRSGRGRAPAGQAVRIQPRLQRQRRHYGMDRGGALHRGAPVGRRPRVAEFAACLALLVASRRKAAICSDFVTFESSDGQTEGLPTMSRAAFIENVAKKGKLSKAEAKRTVDLVLGEIEAGIKKVEEGRPLFHRQLRHLQHRQAQGAQGPQPADRRGDSHPGLQGPPLPPRGPASESGRGEVIAPLRRGRQKH